MDEQLTLSEYLQRSIECRKVMELTSWINSQGKAQYTQVKDLVRKKCAELEITDDEDKIERLANTISVYILNQSLGYMKYLREY